jgi:hypothetical protein
LTTFSSELLNSFFLKFHPTQGEYFHKSAKNTLISCRIERTNGYRRAFRPSILRRIKDWTPDIAGIGIETREMNIQPAVQNKFGSCCIAGRKLVNEAG